MKRSIIEFSGKLYYLDICKSMLINTRDPNDYIKIVDIRDFTLINLLKKKLGLRSDNDPESTS